MQKIKNIKEFERNFQSFYDTIIIWKSVRAGWKMKIPYQRG